VTKHAHHLNAWCNITITQWQRSISPIWICQRKQGSGSLFYYEICKM